MLKAVDSVGLEQRSNSLHLLYDRFGAMLLGYITDAVQNTKLAEECLITVFSDWIKQDGNVPENCTWLQLQQFARPRIAAFRKGKKLTSNKVNVTDSRQLWLKMTNDQQVVFYSAYHCSMPIASIALVLNKPEVYIRKTLVEAFAIMRKA